jgi:hypothetical protein
VATVYDNLEQKPYQSHYLHAETTLDHVVAKVWPHALAIGTWMSAHRLETVAGEPARVGHFERVYPRGIESGVGLPHYHVYGIAHIIPYKYIALEVLPEMGGSYGNSREWMSFDGLLLTDLGNRTHITFLLVDVHMGKGDDASYQCKEHELATDGNKLIHKYFDNLKRILSEAG